MSRDALIALAAYAVSIALVALGAAALAGEPTDHTVVALILAAALAAAWGGAFFACTRTTRVRKGHRR